MPKTVRSQADNTTLMQSVHARLRQVLGPDINYSELSRELGLNAETIRRQLTAAMPTVPFLEALTTHRNLDIHWLITGVGPKTLDERVAWALDHASTQQLMTAVGDRIDGTPPNEIARATRETTDCSKKT